MTESNTQAAGPWQPEADSGHDYPMPTPSAATAEQFYAGVIGPATLSVAASRLAMDKAADADTLQFANFELREAIAVTAVLENLHIPVPPMSPGGRDLLETLQTAPAGMTELYGRYVATLVLTAFQEHIVLSKNIVQALAA